MVPIAARARARSPAEPLGETRDGPNARCVAIRTRRASKFIPALALEPRDGSQKTWGAASNPNQPEISRNAGARRSTGRRLTLDSLTRGLEAKTDVLVVAGTVLAGTRLLALGAEAVGVGERRDGVSLGLLPRWVRKKQERWSPETRAIGDAGGIRTRRSRQAASGTPSRSAQPPCCLSSSERAGARV